MYNMFLFPKYRKTSQAQSPQTPRAQNKDSPAHPYSPVTSTHSESIKRSSLRRRSQTIARSFRSLRKSRNYEPTFLGDIYKSSKTELGDLMDQKSLYSEYDPSNPDHIGETKSNSCEEQFELLSRGRRRAVSASKLLSLRRRSRSARSNMRSPSPKKSSLRDTASGWLDSSSKTLREWANVFYKRGAVEDEPDVAQTVESPVRSLPIDIPNTAPTLDLIELGTTNFMSEDNIPLTARPTDTPHFGPLKLASVAPSPDRFSLEYEQKSRTILPVAMGVSAVPAATESPPIINNLSIGITTDPFTDDAGITECAVSCPTSNVDEIDTKKPCGSTSKDSANSVSSSVAHYPLQRAPAKRKSISAVRAKTTEEAIERIVSGADKTDLDSDASTEVSVSDNGSEESQCSGWARRETCEEIRARFKQKQPLPEEAEAVLGSHTAGDENNMHPKPLTIRMKGNSSITSEGSCTSTVLQSETTEPSLQAKISSLPSIRESPPKRNFRFANNSPLQPISPSSSPDHIKLPSIITLDHEVNNRPAIFDSNNRFAVLADMRDSKSDNRVSASPTNSCKCDTCRCNPCKCGIADTQESQPSLLCKCDHCRCISCRCGKVMPPERALRHLHRSELSIISDMSEEERQCKGIV